MVRLGGLPTAALIFALLSPIATAAGAADGTFLIHGTVVFPESSEFTFSPLVIFTNDTDGMRRFEGSAKAGVLHVYEREVREVDNPLLPVHHRGEIRRERVPLQDVRFTMTGSDAGHLGFYPERLAEAVHAPEGVSLVERRERTEVFTAKAADSDEDPHKSGNAYLQTIERPHLYWESAGSISYVGDAVVKVFGLDVQVRAGNVTRTFETGTQPREEGAVNTLVVRWLVLELESGEVAMDAAIPWIVAAQSSTAAWEGRAFFETVSGQVTTPSTRYEADAEPLSLDGRFHGRFEVPAAGGARGIRLTFQGDLRSTDLAAQGIPVSTRIANSSFFDAPLLLAFAFAGGLAGAGYAAGAWRGSRRLGGSAQASSPPVSVAPVHQMPFTAEDCCDAGAKAAGEEDWAAAAKWFGRAHHLAPTSARICADLAFSLTQIGDLDRALVLYAQASHLSEDGEADFNAALATLHADRPLDEVESWLERALTRSPALVLTLDGDNDFSALEGRPRYENAVQDAWDAMERAEG